MGIKIGSNTTPVPSAKIREACNRIVNSMGGRGYPTAAHAERVRLCHDDDAPPADSPRRVELAECGHIAVLVDLPYTGEGGEVSRVRLCVNCDAVPRVPRILKRAHEVTGE